MQRIAKKNNKQGNCHQLHQVVNSVLNYRAKIEEFNKTKHKLFLFNLQSTKTYFKRFRKVKT